MKKELGHTISFAIQIVGSRLKYDKIKTELFCVLETQFWSNSKIINEGCIGMIIFLKW
jgi:hypothetical protein